MVAVSTAEIEYCGCDRDTQFLDFIGRLTSIKPCKGRLFSCLPHLDSRLEDQLTEVRAIKEGITSPPCCLIDSFTFWRVPCERARQTTLYSFANRRDNEDPNPGPTPAITASPSHQRPKCNNWDTFFRSHEQIQSVKRWRSGVGADRVIASAAALMTN